MGFLKVLPGTVMETPSLSHELRDRDEPPHEILSTKYMPYCALRFLKVLEDVFEHTYNSGRFVYTLKYLTEADGNAFAFYKKFAYLLISLIIEYSLHKVPSFCLIELNLMPVILKPIFS